MKSILFIILTMLTSYSIAQEVSTKVLDLSSGKKLYLVIKKESNNHTMCRIYDETGDVIHETQPYITYQKHILSKNNEFITIKESIPKEGIFSSLHSNFTIINTNTLEKRSEIGNDWDLPRADWNNFIKRVDLTGYH